MNVINQSTGATVQSADGYIQDGSAVVDLLITDMERGGPVSSQMQQTFGLSRKAQRCPLNQTRSGGFLMPEETWQQFNTTRSCPLPQRADQNMTQDTARQTTQTAVGPLIITPITTDLKATWTLQWIFTLARRPRGLSRGFARRRTADRGRNWFQMPIDRVIRRAFSSRRCISSTCQCRPARTAASSPDRNGYQ